MRITKTQDGPHGIIFSCISARAMSLITTLAATFSAVNSEVVGILRLATYSTLLTERTVMEVFTAIATALTPILLSIVGFILWKYRQAFERKARLEQDLRDERIGLYDKILEPFVILFTSDAAWKKDRKNRNKNKYGVAEEKMLSLEYRKVAFKLRLIANDEVLRAYDNLMSYFSDSSPDTFTQEKNLVLRLQKMRELLGNFLLALRKGMGNEDTELTSEEMAAWIFNFKLEIEQTKREERM
ncbi:MAG: hypothetical protein F4065_07525 [Rhodothermaceae bacterium]|nr:hypothetical protein [Rhodothermaceae bacterium]MXZ59204.1 hypothetical protein [Rhodothermaceae bacterium]MYB90218.1 hypothetical protein [Rhodothermaceae bacterium]MYD68606.1 hypothetical protein [Rhodothermaceae bacterium]MYG45738.1 hypothetical protein [Rhodothermaceae bacterium]